MRHLRFSLAVILAAAAAAASASDLTGASAPGLFWPASVRQLGMGDVSLAGKIDVLRGASNPALLADMDRDFELTVNGGPMFGSLQSAGAIGGGWKLQPDWALGAFVSNVSASFKQVDEFGVDGDTLSENNGAGALAFAYKWSFLRLGGAAKFIMDSTESESNGTMAGDLGIKGEWSGASLGLSVRNLGGRVQQPAQISGDGDEVVGTEGLAPMELRLGFGFTYQPWSLSGGLETSARTGVVGQKVGVGLEWWPWEYFGLRAGRVGVASEEISSDARNTFGLTVAYKQFALDYALSTAALGMVNRVGLSWAFSRGPAGAVAPREETRQETAPVQEAAAPAKPAGTLLNVAIADLRGENVSAGDAAVMADLLRNELVKTGKFNVIEKQNMDKVLAEHAFQQTGCSSEECAVKLGKLLNVQRMAVGSFGKLMDSYILSIRVVNVESGAIGFADSAEGKTVGELRNGVKDLAARMAKQIR